MKTLPRISEAEWAVMAVVWDRGSATATEVAEALAAQRQWSERTVKTLLARLLKKQALEFEPDGKRYVYFARVSREQCVKAESRSFLQRVFGGAATPLVMHFLRESRLTAEDLAELQRVLREREKVLGKGKR